MSYQRKSLMPSSLIPSGSHHRTHETHRSSSYSHSHVHTQRSTSHHTATTSVKEWRSEMNSSGHLVIAKKSEPSKSAEKTVEKKIFSILTDFNNDATVDEVEQTTGKIMKEIRKFNRGEDNGPDRPSTSQTTASTSSKLPISSERKLVTSSLKVTPRNINVVNPKNAANRLADQQMQKRKSVQKIPRELLQLINSDGYVEKLPTESKRTPKKVTRYSELQFATSTRSSGRRMSIKEGKIDKKFVRANTSTSSSSSLGYQYKKSTTVTQTKQISVDVQRTVEMVRSDMPSVSTAESVSPRTTTDSIPRNSGNFMHNRVKITHYPMIEVKLEPQ